MIVKIGVVRNTAELKLRCVNGSYRIVHANGSSLLTAGEVKSISLTTPLQTRWIKRTALSSTYVDTAIPTGCSVQLETQTLDQRTWWTLEHAAETITNDPLYTHACEIAKSANPMATPHFPDERPISNATLLDGWTPISAPLSLLPLSEESLLEIANVRVGIGFHWDHTRSIAYHGPFEIHVLPSGLCAVVHEPLETYLAVVNSSEMIADLPIEFLKAQTVAARSWLLANLGTHHPGAPFDICSDDHCQCYQGSERALPASIRAATETAGELLISGDSITDARYAKTCGGRVEPGENVWGGATPGLPYADDSVTTQYSPIASEADAHQILTSLSEDDFCNPQRYPYPDSLKFAEQWYRWSVALPHAELQSLIKRSTGVDIGQVNSFEIMQRGPSGRILAMRIHGEAKVLDINGELAIRRLLSRTHLPSSAIIFEPTPDGFQLHGAGWGHGAGLCQTGGTIRELQGQNYRTILRAYYPDSNIHQMSSFAR